MERPAIVRSWTVGSTWKTTGSISRRASLAASRSAPTIPKPRNGRYGGSMGALPTAPWTRRIKGVLRTASAPFMSIMCRTGSRCACASFGRTSLQSPPAGSRLFQVMPGKRGKRTGSWSSSGPRKDASLSLAYLNHPRGGAETAELRKSFGAQRRSRKCWPKASTEMAERIHSTQSAMNTLVSPCFAALRLEQKTIFLPSGEKRLGDYKFCRRRGFKYVPKPAKPYDDERVKYKLSDVTKYSGKRVVIVGAGNSAIEAAIDLAAYRSEEGVELICWRDNAVSLAIRSNFKSDLKLGNKMMIYDCMDAGRVKAYFGQTIKEVSPDEVALMSA